MTNQGDIVPLGNRLKELRARHDLTQEALAEMVGVSRQSIISIEKGRYSPSVTLALRMARVLQVPVEEAFWLDDDEELA
ncbi:MAG: helix-turn-helix transcriptional regulator [Anaerolineae bacterium]|nr:helix-turn-helix transcriptional regulator [Anaerolineae bacterium]